MKPHVEESAKIRYEQRLVLYKSIGRQEWSNNIGVEVLNGEGHQSLFWRRQHGWQSNFIEYTENDDT